jgi:hypothetical protein
MASTVLRRRFGRKVFGAVVGLVVVLTSCSDSGPEGATTTTTDSGDATSTSASPSSTTTTPLVTEDLVAVREPGCESPPGTPTSLADEPARWLAYGSYFRWRYAAGCPVRVDVISETAGAEHCGWQDARLITVGRPLGRPIGRTFSPERSNRYVWNDGGVIDGLAPGRTITTTDLPPSASASGYHLGEQTLWSDPADETVLYIVTGDQVQVFTREAQAGLCM